MRALIKTIDPVLVDRDGICKAQTTAGAGSLTLNGDLVDGNTVAQISQPAHVSIYSAGNNSGVTFTVTGTDRYGNSLTEAITGPNATTVYGDKNFRTVTSVTVDDAITGNAEVGNGNVLESAWWPVDYHIQGYNTHVKESSDLNMNYVVQHTFDDPWASSFDESTAEAIDGSPEGPVRALRVSITNFVAGDITFYINQKENY